MARFFGAISVFFFTIHVFAVPDIYSFPSEKESQRFQGLTQELRCLVCQNQSLADSDAPLAKDLRNKVYAMVNSNKSDQEIKQYLVGRYGEFILFSPKVCPLTWLLWGFPVFMLLLGILMVIIL